MVIAGASGFVGSRLRASLSDRFRWLALTRSDTVAASVPDAANTVWRKCDLYSLPQVSEALEGARYGVYLVHSMLPSSRLVQGHFKDMDLLLADNFARAARENGLEHIVYLGGLLPEEEGNLSPHLASRAEVETVLRESGLPVTVLRAGLIFGPGGSSTRMLINLVRRLPLMVLPGWTRCRTASIDVRDILRAFERVIDAPENFGRTYDLATHSISTYEEMILQTAKALGRCPRVIRTPIHAIRFSRLWVSLFSSVPKSLVEPLMESVRYDLIPRENPLNESLRENAVNFHQSVIDSVDESGAPRQNPRHGYLKKDTHRLKSESRVRSVQRMPLPGGITAPMVSAEYGRWLTRSSLFALFVQETQSGNLVFALKIPPITLLVLTPTPHSKDSERRRAYYISGGILARPVSPPGRFEFRLFPEHQCLIAAIHGFAPRLPWYIYGLTQAPFHLIVMSGFAKHLSQIDIRGSSRVSDK